MYQPALATIGPFCEREVIAADAFITQSHLLWSKFRQGVLLVRVGRGRIALHYILRDWERRVLTSCRLAGEASNTFPETSWPDPSALGGSTFKAKSWEEPRPVQVGAGEVCLSQPSMCNQAEPQISWCRFVGFGLVHKCPRPVLKFHCADYDIGLAMNACSLEGQGPGSDAELC